MYCVVLSKTCNKIFAKTTVQKMYHISIFHQFSQRKLCFICERNDNNWSNKFVYIQFLFIICYLSLILKYYIIIEFVSLSLKYYILMFHKFSRGKLCFICEGKNNSGQTKYVYIQFLFIIYSLSLTFVHRWSKLMHQNLERYILQPISK